ncbi:MAG: two-component system sensor histidine kinase NtrB [Brevinematia bacterium]
MVVKQKTFNDKILELKNILQLVQSFKCLLVIDNDRRTLYLKQECSIDEEEAFRIFKEAKNNFINHKISTSFFNSSDQGTIIALYTETSLNEIVIIGGSKKEEISQEDIAIFKLISIVISNILLDLESMAETSNKIQELEELLSFYKAITKPINREFFLAYILDKIISEIGSEVGSIVIVDKNLSEIASFHLGLDSEKTNRIIEFLKNNGITSKITALNQTKIRETFPEYSKTVKNMIIYPIEFEGEILGFTILANKRIGFEYSSFTLQDISKLEVLIKPASINIKNYVMFRELFILNQLSQKILSNINTTILITDKNGQIIYINKINNAELAKKIIETTLPPLTYPMKDKEEIQIENKFYEVSIQPIFDETGQISEILWTVEDISYKKELINKYIISEKMNVISELVSGIAHEIRNPISSINGFIELLKIKKNDEDFINKFIEIVSKDTQRIINLLNSFIKFSKPIEYEIENVNLSSVIREAIDIMSYQINQKGISVKNKLDTSITVKGNYNLLLQVFTNLIINSVQAINKNNGKIEIGYMNYYEKESEYIVVYVKDNGIGIPQEIQDKVFDPFFTTKQDGTGLGLSICQKIIIDLKGIIKIKSKENEGTTVMVFLPK